VTPSFNPSRLISVKRDGGALSEVEIEAFVRAFLDDQVADYQMAAFLMAVYCRGMSGEETAALTRAMADSGDRLDLSSIPNLKVDKHSTGGVGDKVSIPLAPLVSACGVPVPMISGRGLGHTGGTLDKLESIPGFRTRLSPAEFLRVLRNVGCVMGGQTERLAPADRRMYAIRDVTATVESIPLIVSSILSKKVAEGAQGLVMDVKCGRGAFMADEARARSLGLELVRVGEILGLRVAAFITDMDRPLGRTIGHALEIEESIQLLKGGGPPDLKEITLALGSAMLVLGGVAWDLRAGSTRLNKAVADGSGLARFRELIAAQGGDPAVIDDPDLLPRAPVRVAFRSDRAGFITDMNPRTLGEAVIELGGGRRRAEDAIDPAVGLRIHRVPGDAVSHGEPIMTIEAATEAVARGVLDTHVRPSTRVDREPPRLPPLIRSFIFSSSEWPWDPVNPPEIR
jgi:pyrimidine-nucleoside phosphorylase